MINKRVVLKKSYAKWEIDNLIDLFGVGGKLSIRGVNEVLPSLLTVQGHAPVGKVIGKGTEDAFLVEFKLKGGIVVSAYYERKDLKLWNLKKKSR